MLIWLDARRQDLATEHGLVRAADYQSVVTLGSVQERLADHETAVIDEARRTADRLVQEAEQQARQRIADAQSAIAEELEVARQRGYEDGLRQAVVDWHARQSGATIEQARALSGLHDRLANIVATAVERIVHAEPREALYLRALRHVQSLTRGASSLTLRVHADDLAQATAGVGALASDALSGLHVEVVSDPCLRPGACVFETEGGVLDASLHTQLDGLREAMNRAVRRAVQEGAGADKPKAPSDATASTSGEPTP